MDIDHILEFTLQNQEAHNISRAQIVMNQVISSKIVLRKARKYFGNHQCNVIFCF